MGMPKTECPNCGGCLVLTTQREGKEIKHLYVCTKQCHRPSLPKTEDTTVESD
jgi:hypothetical protein